LSTTHEDQFKNPKEQAISVLHSVPATYFMSISSRVTNFESSAMVVYVVQIELQESNEEIVTNVTDITADKKMKNKRQVVSSHQSHH